MNQLTSIRQNKFWKKGPGKNRPRNLTGLDIQWNLNEQTAFTQMLANQLDEGPIPAAEVENVRKRFGVNKTRYWTKPVNCTGYLPMNMATAALRQQHEAAPGRQLRGRPQGLRAAGRA